MRDHSHKIQIDNLRRLNTALYLKSFEKRIMQIAEEIEVISRTADQEMHADMINILDALESTDILMATAVSKYTEKQDIHKEV